MEENVQAYYEKFLKQQPKDSTYFSRTVNAEKWGVGVEMANELGSLIANGIKTATCSSKWEWEFDGEKWPDPGQLTIVLDGHDRPLCIIETTEIMIKPFDEVDPQFAYEEGEGDRSLEYWRNGHRRFFEAAMLRIGRDFDEKIPLICERFRKIYPIE